MTATDTDLNALLGRVKAATGADRELSRDIWQALDTPEWKAAYMRAQEPCGCPHDQAVEYAIRHLHDVTASIDAAKAFAERLGWRLYTVDASIEGRFNVLLAGPKRLQWSEEMRVEVTIPDYAGGVHSDFCLAILAATLQALISRVRP